MSTEEKPIIAAHAQKVSHGYTVHYPDHAPRTGDPHYGDFEEYKRKRRLDGTWHCDFAQKHRAGNASECDLSKPLECHHQHIEFAVQQGVDLSLLEADYPGVSSLGVGAWIETAENLELLCVFHHRGHAGAHVASYSDYEALKYVPGLLS
jgi:hypothetical protein